MAQFGMIVTVKIPDSLAGQLHPDEKARSRQLLESFLLQCYAEGEVSAAQIGEGLGLSFAEREEFLHRHRASSGLGSEEHFRGVQNLEALLAR